MIKAVAWRLARLLHAKPSSLVTAPEAKLLELLDRAFPPPAPKTPRIHGRGNAARLKMKLLRLRKK
jgi:hypothetical protein